jgi:transcriptional regulator with XRE-family HTH domain
MDSPRRSSRARWAAAYELFRRRLVIAREKAGLTQREAAQLLGRSQSFVAKSESGERRVDVVELGEFAKTYGRPISYFTRPVTAKS